MRRRKTGTHPGFTLIELTVVLAVIVTLALVLTPSIANIISDSREARARADCQTIAGAIVQFYKDTGFFPQWAVAQNGGPGPAATALDLLVTPGNLPGLDQRMTPVLGQDTLSGWMAGRVGRLADQLIVNAPGYTPKTPVLQFGWNGPYLSSPLGPDPWNNRYMVNVAFIDGSNGVQTTGGFVKSAVWVLSAGPNGVIETPYRQAVNSAIRGGDDIGFRIQ